MADTPTTTPATAPAPATAPTPAAALTLAATLTPAAATVPLASRGKRKQRVGQVISNRMAKTIIVRVERRFPHPKFKKVVTGYKQFYAHDEQRQAKVGDRVRIEETRPLSKTKRWRLVAVMEPSTGVTPGAG